MMCVPFLTVELKSKDGMLKVGLGVILSLNDIDKCFPILIPFLVRNLYCSEQMFPLDNIKMLSILLYTISFVRKLNAQTLPLSYSLIGQRGIKSTSYVFGRSHTKCARGLEGPELGTTALDK